MQDPASIALSPAAILAATRLADDMAGQDAQVRPDLSDAPAFRDYLRFRDAHREKWERNDHFMETWQERLFDLADREGRRLELRGDDAMASWETWYNDIVLRLSAVFWQRWERRLDLAGLFARSAGERRLPVEQQDDSPVRQTAATSARVQYALAVRYETGAGVPTDLARALELYQRAAQQGHARAQVNLARMYYCGEGVMADAAQAFYWYRKAAEQGVAKAQCNVGAMYAKGKGVARDGHKGLEWYRKAAAQGNALAQRKLADAYAAGRSAVAVHPMTCPESPAAAAIAFVQ